jgi:hypothetical protein
MTTNASVPSLPFLHQFAQPIPTRASLPLRYDEARQIAQVLQNGQWIDAPDASDEEAGATRKTAVAQETFDDE